MGLKDNKSGIKLPLKTSRAQFPLLSPDISHGARRPPNARSPVGLERVGFFLDPSGCKHRSKRAQRVLLVAADDFVQSKSLLLGAPSESAGVAESARWIMFHRRGLLAKYYESTSVPA